MRRNPADKHGQRPLLPASWRELLGRQCRPTGPAPGRQNAQEFVVSSLSSVQRKGHGFLISWGCSYATVSAVTVSGVPSAETGIQRWSCPSVLVGRYFAVHDRVIIIGLPDGDWTASFFRPATVRAAGVSSRGAGEPPPGSYSRCIHRPQGIWRLFRLGCIADTTVWPSVHSALVPRSAS